MKKQIRRGVFETNSSSVHSLTMCLLDDYSRWEKGELYFHKYDEVFKTREEIIDELKKATRWDSDELRYPNVDWDDEDEVNDIIYHNNYLTEEEYFGNYDIDTFYDIYITPNGEKVVAFGYYGYDG